MRPAQEGRSNGGKSNYMGVRRRKWGKWVSEIRLPGTQTRLWLGSYSTPEAAAVAHDTAVFYLRGPSSSRGRLNFPMCVPVLVRPDMSPQLIQKAASDTGMAMDARLAVGLPINGVDLQKSFGWDDLGTHGGSELGEDEALNISIDDMEILL